MTQAAIIGALAGCGAAGLLTALAFVTFGVTRVLPVPAAATLGARILLIPGATA